MANDTTDTSDVDWKARYEAADSSLGVLQRKLDDALQKHADDAKAYRDGLDTLKQEHEAKVADLTAAAEKAAKEYADAHKVQEQSWTDRLAKELATLKRDTLAPILAAEHERKRKELDAQHAAELAKLQ